jgi:hypothetical protein
MINELILVIIFIILLVSTLFFITYYKKEKFSQCKELEEGDGEILTGICKPFYGIPPAAAITPYYHQVKPTYKHEPEEDERKKKNREAARELCNITPGCTGISQSTLSSGPNETYLCKNEWNGTDTVNMARYPMETYKCKSHDVDHSPLPPSNKLLDANINTGIFGKSFNEFQYKKHYNNKFKNVDLINIFDSTNKIKFSVKCISSERDHKIKSNLKQYIDFANTMAYCVGFHIHRTSAGYDVYFGKKRDNEDLILGVGNGDYECYTAILTTNNFIHDINELYAFRNKEKIIYSLETWSYTRYDGHTAHGHDFEIEPGYIGILIGWFQVADDPRTAQEMFCCVGEHGGNIFTGESGMMTDPHHVKVEKRSFGGRISFWRRGPVGHTNNVIILKMQILKTY